MPRRAKRHSDQKMDVSSHGASRRAVSKSRVASWTNSANSDGKIDIRPLATREHVKQALHAYLLKDLCHIVAEYHHEYAGTVFLYYDVGAARDAPQPEHEYTQSNGVFIVPQTGLSNPFAFGDSYLGNRVRTDHWIAAIWSEQHNCPVIIHVRPETVSESRGPPRMTWMVQQQYEALKRQDRFRHAQIVLLTGNSVGIFAFGLSGLPSLKHFVEHAYLDPFEMDADPRPFLWNGIDPTPASKLDAVAFFARLFVHILGTSKTPYQHWA